MKGYTQSSLHPKKKKMDDINHCHTRTGSFILFVLVLKDTIRTQQKEATCRTTFERRSLAYPDSRRSIPSINCSRSEISSITVANPGGSYSETFRIPIERFLSILRLYQSLYPYFVFFISVLLEDKIHLGYK